MRHQSQKSYNSTHCPFVLAFLGRIQLQWAKTVKNKLMSCKSRLIVHPATIKYIHVILNLIVLGFRILENVCYFKNEAYSKIIHKKKPLRFIYHWNNRQSILDFTVNQNKFPNITVLSIRVVLLFLIFHHGLSNVFSCELIQLLN